MRNVQVRFDEHIIATLILPTPYTCECSAFLLVGAYVAWLNPLQSALILEGLMIQQWKPSKRCIEQHYMSVEQRKKSDSPTGIEPPELLVVNCLPKSLPIEDSPFLGFTMSRVVKSRIIQVLHGSRRMISQIRVSRKIKSANHASRKYPYTTLFICQCNLDGIHSNSSKLFTIRSTLTDTNPWFYDVVWPHYSRFSHILDLKPFPGATVKLIRWSSLTIIRSRK